MLKKLLAAASFDDLAIKCTNFSRYLTFYADNIYKGGKIISDIHFVLCRSFCSGRNQPKRYQSFLTDIYNFSNHVIDINSLNVNRGRILLSNSTFCI